MAEAHLYLLCTDFLFGEECCMCMAERMEADVGGEVELFLQLPEKMSECNERHWDRDVAQSAKDIVIIRELDPVGKKCFGEHLLPCEQVLHGGIGERDDVDAVSAYDHLCRLGDVPDYGVYVCNDWSLDY